MADEMSAEEREDLDVQNAIEDAKYDFPPQEEPDPWDDDSAWEVASPTADPWVSGAYETGAPF